MIKAKDIMSEHVIVIYDDMLISQVAHLMLRDRVSAFPVVNKASGLVGIITITDLFKIMIELSHGQDINAFYKHLPRIKEMKAGEVMSKAVYSIDPETSLYEIIERLLEKNIHTFPVMEDGKMVGIVGRHDILNAVYLYEGT